MPAPNFNGLTSFDAGQKLQKYGLNEIPEPTNRLLKKILSNLFSPISFMLLAASLLSFFTDKIFDGFFILFLLLLNSFVTLWQERKADNAIKKLNQNLSLQVNVLRDGVWQKVSSKNIVSGDVVKLVYGNVIPADGIILDQKNASFNESTLTGESLPKQKADKEKVFSGSFLTTGLMTMEVSATGVNTYFGKTIFSVEKVRKRSLLEIDIIRVSKFLSALSIVAIIILSLIFFIKRVAAVDILTLDLTLLIAGIPISLPTVMTLIIELGVVELAKKSVIVRRLSALEDLSNVNYLLTDKTGTLTQNLITVQKIISYQNYTSDDVLLFAFLTSQGENESPINQAILKKAAEKNINNAGYEVIDFVPVDLNRKLSSAVLKKDEQTTSVSVGAPQEIEKLCVLNSAQKEKLEKDIQGLAEKGYRAVAVASVPDRSDKNMQLVGLISLSDTLRDEAKDVVDFLIQNGIAVSMVTGDSFAISSEIARKVGLEKGQVLTKQQIENTGWDKVNRETFLTTGAFSEILPEDKFRLVQIAKNYFTVSSNGDGINDLPALKEANVGMAVSNAVDALKATADIVLLSSGITVIKDAIIEARKIFERLYTYSVYRISESQRLIVTIVVLGLIYKVYPLTPLQLILLALLNDIPIITLAFDKVKVTQRPAKINVADRFVLSSLFGMAGIANSLLMFMVFTKVFPVSWEVLQTLFFLKLTVSGHMLIYVAHTKERWFKFLPSKEIIWATSLTQITASFLALTGLFMPSFAPFYLVLFVWIWSFFWMQITEGAKILKSKLQVPA
ncbi:MAG: plasma-membrane proton-efflux P-type ATPase [Patescibacteria group bacterium]|nr:plasma-membrane proton-efflux P-type ATPase [Patescibacteria group bacterium]